jgi:hypothetical protein
MSANLPAGLEFRAIAPLGPGAQALQDAVRLTRYRVSRGTLGSDELRRRIEDFRRSERRPVRRERKGKVQEVDLMPLVEDIGVRNGGISLSLRAVEGPSLRPAEVLAAIFGPEQADSMTLRREEILVEYRGRLLSPIMAARASGRHVPRDHR